MLSELIKVAVMVISPQCWLFFGPNKETCAYSLWKEGKETTANRNEDFELALPFIQI